MFRLVIAIDAHYTQFDLEDLGIRLVSRVELIASPVYLLQEDAIEVPRPLVSHYNLGVVMETSAEYSELRNLVSVLYSS